MQGYKFADQIYHCFADSHCVLLDLRGDRYITVTRRDADIVMKMPQEGVRHEAESPPTSVDDEAARVVGQWLQTGLLVETTSHRGFPEPVSVPRPMESIQESEDLGAPTVVRFLPAFIMSARLAHFSLTHEPLEKTVRDVARRVARARNNKRSFDRSRAEAVVGAFAALRPLFPRNYLCLFDSLALLNLSLRYGLSPNWVFGVQAEPFSAHCWLQEGNVVLYDSVDRVSTYTPIMSI
jgi:hypothetical protein